MKTRTHCLCLHSSKGQKGDSLYSSGRDKTHSRPEPQTSGGPVHSVAHSLTLSTITPAQGRPRPRLRWSSDGKGLEQIKSRATKENALAGCQVCLEETHAAGPKRETTGTKRILCNFSLAYPTVVCPHVLQAGWENRF